MIKMLYYILSDFINGFFDSLRFNLFFKQILSNIKFRKLFYKLIVYNLFLYVLPLLITDILYQLTNFSLHNILYFLYYPINIFSAIFHVIHFVDLINIISSNKSKTNQMIPVVDMIALAVTMTIYQLVIYLTTELINFIFHSRIYLIAISLNFFILTIYHSFYYFNNLWQYFRIGMFRRIDIHEKLWPYYMGYGTVITLIYYRINYSYMMAVYNIYSMALLSFPFLFKTKFPHDSLYPKINLTIFSYFIGWIFKIAGYLMKSPKK